MHGIRAQISNFFIDPLPPPTSVSATAPQAKSFRLKWQQSDGADAVESYKIDYCFTVNECNESNPRCFTIHMIDGSLRGYNINSSSDHPVEEDSTYSIALTAANDVATSEAANISNIVTSRARMYACYKFYLTLKCLSEMFPTYSSLWASAIPGCLLCYHIQHNNRVEGD